MIKDKERAIILKLRKNGLTIPEIAERTGRTIDSVKSFLKRAKQTYGVKCLNCGAPLEQIPHHSPRIYCCRKCAFEYRNKYRLVEKSVKKICEHCGHEFYDEPCSTQRYCSKRCAGLARHNK